ncbi:hypothetical protein [Roseateles sp.]|uniref:hypothetical protein n=1 Tax=Roseateles sp. TaxID=1971397 RepID=UPI0031DCDFD1
MSDFASDIQSGIASANSADGEWAEIRGILDRLDEALQSATFGKAKLFLGEFQNSDDELALSIADLTERLVIRSTEDERHGRIIAGWRTDRDGGYPIELVYNFLSLPCGHGDELMKELAELLRTARVGRIVQGFADGSWRSGQRR